MRECDITFTGVNGLFVLTSVLLFLYHSGSPMRCKKTFPKVDNLKFGNEAPHEQANYGIDYMMLAGLPTFHPHGFSKYKLHNNIHVTIFIQPISVSFFFYLSTKLYSKD